MQHQTVSPDEWLPARRELLAKEKELTRHRDEVNKARLRLPWVKIEMTPLGRNENGPHHNLMDWVKRHDQYENPQ
jgi:predicted dithiol-disulfide oxidoreductase (DUF899 family)